MGNRDPPGMAFTFPIPFESKQDLWIKMLAGEALNITLSFSTSELFAKYLKHVTPKKKSAEVELILVLMQVVWDMLQYSR